MSHVTSGIDFTRPFSTTISGNTASTRRTFDDLVPPPEWEEVLNVNSDCGQYNYRAYHNHGGKFIKRTERIGGMDKHNVPYVHLHSISKSRLFHTHDLDTNLKAALEEIAPVLY